MCHIFRMITNHELICACYSDWISLHYEVLLSTQKKRQPSPYTPLNPSYSLKIILLCDITTISQYRSLNKSHKGSEMCIKDAAYSLFPCVLFHTRFSLVDVDLMSLP